MENKILQNNADFHPKLCLRYVDGIFCVFNNETSSDRFLDLLNKQHKNIKFTAEHGSETLPFWMLKSPKLKLALKQRFKENKLTLTCY